MNNNQTTLSLYDILFDYNNDVINCFEHPIAAILNYFDRTYTNYYITLAKFRGVYTSGNVKELVLQEMSELFNISVMNTSKLSYKQIIENINANNPMLIGVNLKQIFYTEHYMNKNWGHWFLIKGYNRIGNLVTLYDNSQFEFNGHEFGTFNIPYDMLKKANDDYKKEFGKEYNVMLFKKGETIEPISVLKYILAEYIKLDLSLRSNYKQLELLSTLKNLLSEKEGSVDKEFYGNELKKKLINVNKYRNLFHKQMETFMEQSGYDESKVKEFQKLCIELNNQWGIFVMKHIVSSVAGRSGEAEMDLVMIEQEKTVQRILKDYKTFIDGKKDMKTESNNHISYQLENNLDNIIEGTNNKINLNFDGKKIYNWWDLDEAPKIILNSDMKNQDFIIQTIINIDKKYCAPNYEAGIFIRNQATGQSLMFGIENQENIVMDEVEITGHKLAIEKSDFYQVFLKNTKGVLEAGLCMDGEHKTYFQYDYGNIEGVEIGLVCKTWGKGGPLKLSFELDRINL